MHKTLKPIITGVLITFGGTFLVTYFGLYETIPHLDKFFHVADGFVVSWFFGKLWEDELKSFNHFQRFLILIGMAITVGFFWEIMEYATSIPFFDNHQIIKHYFYSGGFHDTMGDLFADMFGAGLFAILIFF